MGFEYTSVQVSVSEGMIPHRDANNLGPSWTIFNGRFPRRLVMGGVQRRMNTSSIHSTRTGTKCEGKQSCDQGQMGDL
eukprot:12896736-Prorocentrum_lima.AAC.1